jgi:hypothetical protein
LIEKILGITDSRLPGRRLTNLEAVEILQSFGISECDIESPYGVKGCYIFYKKDEKYIKCYRGDSTESMILATELQDRLSYYNLAPKVLDEVVSQDYYINISDFMAPLSCRINNNILSNNLMQLHNKFFFIFHEWKRGLSAVEDTTRSMHKMLNEYSAALFDTYDIHPNAISNFYEVLSWIKKQDNYGHGDMHPGNILQDKNNYVFIDFESVFQSKGGRGLDFHNLKRFNVGLVNGSEYAVKITNYLYVKSAIVNHYLECTGKNVSLQEKQKFLQKIYK